MVALWRMRIALGLTFALCLPAAGEAIASIPKKVIPSPIRQSINGAPRPDGSQPAMTLNQRRNQVKNDIARARLPVLPKKPPAHKRPTPAAGPRKNNREAAPQLGAYQRYIKMFDSSGTLVAYGRDFVRAGDIHHVLDFIPKEGEKYTLETEVYYQNPDGNGKLATEDLGLQPVDVRASVACVYEGASLDGYDMTEPKTVTAPSWVYSPDSQWTPDQLPERPGAKVSFTFVYNSESCVRGWRQLEKENGGVMATDRSSVFRASITSEDRNGNWHPWTYGPAYGIDGSDHAALPANQTYGLSCDSNSASAAHCQTHRGMGVNTATGAFNQVFTDASLPGALPLNLTRSYSSNNPLAGPLGVGWSVPWDASLKIDAGGNSVVFHAEDGSQYPYTKGADGLFSGPITAASKLRSAGDGYVLETRTGDTVTFDSAGHMLAKKNKQGQATNFAYDAGKLAAVTNPSGRKANLRFNGDRLAEVTLSDGRKVAYTYTGEQLSAVTGVDGGTVTYDYDASGRLTTITDQRGGVVVRNGYDTSGRTTQQTDSVGGKTIFSYAGGETDVTAPDGGVWSDVYRKNVLQAQYDPFGNKTSYGYSYALDPVTVTDALGKTVTTTVTNGRLMRVKGPISEREWFYSPTTSLVNAYRDENGKTSRYSYDSANRLATSTDARSGVTKYTYTPAGQVATVTSPSGKQTVYGYDAAGNQISVTAPGGSRESRTFDAAGYLRTVTDPRGNAEGAEPAHYTTTYAYDAAGRITSVRDPKGHTALNGYDAAGNLTSVTDNTGQISTRAYDAANRLTETRDPAGNVSKLEYDVMGNVAAQTDGAGAKATYTYDKAGRLVSMTTGRGNVAGANAAVFTWKYGYDKVGNQTTVTDPAGKTTRTDYDAEYRPIKVTDPLGRTQQTSYDAAGHVLTTTDALGQVTTWSYDANNQVTSVKDRSGNTITYAYDADGNRTSETSPLGHKTTYGYDADSRRTERVEPRGNVTGADPAQYTWRTGYDPAGNVLSETDPLGNKQSSVYDGVGNVAERTDPLGKKTAFEYDALNRLSKVTAPDGGTTLVEYDVLGRVSKRTDANQRVTLYGYDKAGRLTKVTDPLNRSTSYEYDADGNRTKVTNARGQTMASSFDGRGLLTKTSYSDGSPPVSYAHYDDGRPKTIADGTGTRTLTYDGEGRPLTISQPGVTSPFKYTYNPNGTVASRTYPDGRATTYQYDNDGRVTGQSTNSKTTAYGWDAAGNLTSTKLPTTTARTENRTYDRAGRLASLSEGTGNRFVERDAAGRVISDTFRGLSTAKPSARFAYDPTGRLARACTDDTGLGSCLDGTSGETYTYDTVGNLTSTKTPTTTTTNTFDAADQLTRSVTGTATADLTYDLDGNLTKDATGSYTYTAEGRIKSATIGTNAYTFGYDADGNRTSSTLNGTALRTTWWDVNNKLPKIATDRSATNVLVGDYQYTPQGSALEMDSPAGSFYLQHDRQESITRLYDAAGTENYAYTYGPWGATTATASIPSGQKSLFGFTGEYKDPYVPNQLHLRARNYSTTTGRFTTPDPQPTEAGSANASPYAYANNDPVNQADPSGRCPLCISAGIGAVIGGVVEGGIYSWQHRNDAQFSWGGLAGATGKGALIGGAAGALMPGAGNAVVRGLGFSGARGIATSAAVNAGVGAGFSWAVNGAQCRPTDPWDLLFGAAGGASSSLIGPAFNWLRGVSGKPVPRYGPGAAHADDPALRGAGGFNVASMTEEPGFNYLYRGLSVRHPGYDDAVRGVSKPRGGTASMETHHDGNTDSIYTSWDTSRETALRYARGAAEGRRDLPGVILQVKLPLGQPIYPSMMFSSDLWEGTEHLVEGLLRGAKVWHVPAP